jgi:nicotinamide-nucleotide amidase
MIGITAAILPAMFPTDLTAEATRLLAACRARQIRLATAESCTGGLIAGLLTAVPGSSDVVDRGFVTYSNEAKQEMLAVPADVIARDGAVSAPCAEAMARGALAASRAGLAVAVTGVAGPGGGSAAKPVGLVFLATASSAGVEMREMRYGALTRDEIRLRTVATALEMLLASVDQAGRP